MLKILNKCFSHFYVNIKIIYYIAKSLFGQTIVTSCIPELIYQNTQCKLIKRGNLLLSCFYGEFFACSVTGFPYMRCLHPL